MCGMHSSWDDNEDGKKEKKKAQRENWFWDRELYIVSKMIEQKEVWGF